MKPTSRWFIDVTCTRFTKPRSRGGGGGGDGDGGGCLQSSEPWRHQSLLLSHGMLSHFRSIVPWMWFPLSMCRDTVVPLNVPTNVCQWSGLRVHRCIALPTPEAPAPTHQQTTTFPHVSTSGGPTRGGVRAGGGGYRFSSKHLALTQGNEGGLHTASQTILFMRLFLFCESEPTVKRGLEAGCLRKHL